MRPHRDSHIAQDLGRNLVSHMLLSHLNAMVLQVRVQRILSSQKSDTAFYDYTPTLKIRSDATQQLLKSILKFGR